jgi:hypothetical protein
MNFIVTTTRADSNVLQLVSAFAFRSAAPELPVLMLTNAGYQTRKCIRAEWTPFVAVTYNAGSAAAVVVLVTVALHLLSGDEATTEVSELAHEVGFTLLV